MDGSGSLRAAHFPGLLGGRDEAPECQQRSNEWENETVRFQFQNDSCEMIPLPSSIVNSLLAWTRSKISFPPLNQRTSNFSACRLRPRPKCKRKSHCEQKLPRSSLPELEAGCSPPRSPGTQSRRDWFLSRST